MDTLIFSGLLLTMFGILKRTPHRLVLLAWLALLVWTLVLFAQHTTSDLGLGLTY